MKQSNRLLGCLVTASVAVILGLVLFGTVIARSFGDPQPHNPFGPPGTVKIRLINHSDSTVGFEIAAFDWVWLQPQESQNIEKKSNLHLGDFINVSIKGQPDSATSQAKSGKGNTLVFEYKDSVKAP